MSEGEGWYRKGLTSDIDKFDIPRNNMGWPCIEPSQMNEYWLRKEGERWRRTAIETYEGTVGYAEWKKYATELKRRGFIELVDTRIPLLSTDMSDTFILMSNLVGRKIVENPR